MLVTDFLILVFDIFEQKMNGSSYIDECVCCVLTLVSILFLESIDQARDCFGWTCLCAFGF